MVLGVVTAAIGFWLMNASRTLDSACTLSAHSGGGNSCVSGVPFQLLGIALTATGVASTVIALVASIRGIRRKVTHRKHSTITTLARHEVEPLREVA
jgi:hypothetical protein